MTYTKESELAKDIMEIMIKEGWDCYPEASLQGSFPDILGFKNNLTWIVETKMSASLSVLDQASSWLGIVNYVSIGLPKRPKSFFFEKVCCEYGIGLMVPGNMRSNPVGINEAGYCEYSINQHDRIPPKFFRKTVFTSDELRKKVNPLMKDFIPGGTSSDGRFSPWRHTMNQTYDYIKNNPGCKTADIAKNIDHHYRTDKDCHACLLQYLRDNSLVRREIQNRYVVYYPAETQQQENHDNQKSEIQ